jgi:hypothetical protein
MNRAARNVNTKVSLYNLELNTIGGTECEFVNFEKRNLISQSTLDIFSNKYYMLEESSASCGGADESGYAI